MQETTLEGSSYLKPIVFCMVPEYYFFTVTLMILGFVLGSSLASFAGVVIERTPKGEPITGRSHCSCGRALKWHENVPVFGWLRLKGTTKCCNSKLPQWYLWSELIAGVFGALTVGIIIFTL